MKILPKHTSLPRSGIALLSLSLVLILFLPYIVAFSFRGHIAFLILALLLLVTPWANKRTPLENSEKVTDHRKIKQRPFIKCLAITWLLQAALILAFYTICHLTATTLPIHVAPFPLFRDTLSILLINWGIFPWGFYVLMAAGIAYMVYIKKQPGDMSTLVRPLLKNKPQGTTSIVADGSTKLAVALTLGFTLALISLECMGLIGAFFHLPLAYGMRLDVLLCMLVVLQASKGDFFDRQISRLSNGRSSSSIIIRFLLCAIAGFLLMSLLIGILSPILTPPLNRVIDFAPETWPAIWATFSAVWWLGWTPLVAGTMAHIWRGYKIHTMMFWMLLLPIMTTALKSSYPSWDLSISLNTSLFNLVPALSSGALMGMFFLRTQTITHVWKATLPTVLHNNYQSYPKIFLKRLLHIVLTFMGLFWASGIYIPGLFYFVLLFPMELFVIAAGIAVFTRLLFDFGQSQR